MQKGLFLKVAIFSILILASQLWSAEPLQVFTLKDGSIIKGRMVSYAQGVYTVQSEQLGKLQIPVENVVSVTNTTYQDRPAQQTQSSPSSPSARSSDIAEQVTNAHNQIMANPALMQEIEKMANDKELAGLLSDPGLKNDLMNALQNNDPRAVENNPKLKKILQNPHMQNLLKQFSSGAALRSQ